MNKTWKIVPIKTQENDDRTYHEQGLVYEGAYPVHLIHIDTFWQPRGSNEIYDLFNAGETFELDVNFTLIVNNEE